MTEETIVRDAFNAKLEAKLRKIYLPKLIKNVNADNFVLVDYLTEIEKTHNINATTDVAFVKFWDELLQAAVVMAEYNKTTKSTGRTIMTYGLLTCAGVGIGAVAWLGWKFFGKAGAEAVVEAAETVSEATA